MKRSCLVIAALFTVHCSGDDGATGKTSLVRLAAEPAGANCANGGTAIAAGVDDNGNGTLEDGEVDSTSYSCESAGAQNPECKLVPYGSCTNTDLRFAVFAGTNGDYAGVDLTGVDLSGSDLRGAVFLGVPMSRVKLTGAKLDNAYISDTVIADADLSGVSMKSTHFSTVLFSRVKLDDADLSKATLNRVTMADVSAPRAKFVGAGAFTSTSLFIRADLTAADFTDLRAGDSGPATVGIQEATLTGAKFVHADLRSVAFIDTQSDLTNADLSFATVVGTDFTNALMTGVNLINAYFDSTTVFPGGLVTTAALNLTALGNNLSGKDLHFFKGVWAWNGKNLTDAILTGMSFNGVNLSTTDLTRAKLAGAELSGANLDGATLLDADLTGANLYNATISSTTAITGANFTRACLMGLDFTTMNVNGTNFSRATLFGAKLAATSGAAIWDHAFVRDTTLPAAATGTYAVALTPSLPNGDLAGIHVVNGAFVAASLAGADLSGARLIGSFFNSGTLTGVNLTNAVITDSDLYGVDLTGANLTGAKFSYTTLLSSKLDNANFTNASLLCSVAGDEDIQGTYPTTSGATWSNTTCSDSSVSDDNGAAGCGERFDTTYSTWKQFICFAS